MAQEVVGGGEVGCRVVAPLGRGHGVAEVQRAAVERLDQHVGAAQLLARAGVVGRERGPQHRPLPPRRGRVRGLGAAQEVDGGVVRGERGRRVAGEPEVVGPPERAGAVDVHRVRRELRRLGQQRVGLARRPANTRPRATKPSACAAQAAQPQAAGALGDTARPAHAAATGPEPAVVERHQLQRRASSPCRASRPPRASSPRAAQGVAVAGAEDVGDAELGERADAPGGEPVALGDLRGAPERGRRPLRVAAPVRPPDDLERLARGVAPRR